MGCSSSSFAEAFCKVERAGRCIRSTGMGPLGVWVCDFLLLQGGNQFPIIVGGRGSGVSVGFVGFSMCLCY